MKTTKSRSRALVVIISAHPRRHLWYVADLGWGANIFLLIVICHTFDRLAYRASPDSTSKSRGQCACTRTIWLSQKHKLRNWNVHGLPNHLVHDNVHHNSSVLVRQSSISPPTFLQTTATTILLRHLNQPITWKIKYDICSPPSFTTSHHYLIDNDQWQYQRVSNPGLGFLTIYTALVTKPIVVFPLRIDNGPYRMGMLPGNKLFWKTGL